MAELSVCSAAYTDYAEALSWYATRSPVAAERFEHDVENALQTIAATPNRFPRCDARHRYYSLRNFPYRIIYRKVQYDWVVVALAHAAREPGFWSKR